MVPTVLTYLNKQMETIDVAYKVSDRKLLAHIMSRLPEGYKEIVTTLDSKLSTIMLTEVMTTITRFHERWLNELGLDKRTVKNELAMATTEKRKPKFDGNCAHCGIYGHATLDCWSRKKEQEQSNANSNNGKDPNATSQANGVNQGRRMKCWKCKKNCHLLQDCPTKKGTAGTSSGMFVGATDVQVCTPTVQNHESWLVDTGASVHVTNDKHLLLYNVRSGEDKRIVVGTGTTKTAKLIGDVKLSEVHTGAIFILRDVLYVEGFTKNLMSVSCLVRKGNKLLIDDDCLTILNGTMTMTFWKGDDAMFYLDVTRLAQENESELAAVAIKANEKTSAMIIQLNPSQQ
jgi:hypothetical protein